MAHPESITRGSPMADPTLAPERTRTFLAQQAQDMDGGELRAELLAGGAFLLTATLLAVVGGLQGGAPPAVVAAYVVALAATSTVRFDVGASFTVPTQVLFLPLLVLAPPGLVPLLVAAALVLAQVPGVLRGGARASRMLSAPANAWFAVGAAAVVLAGGGIDDPFGEPALLAAAVVAQLACDFAASLLRERLLGSLTLRELVEESRHVWMIDVALSPVGLLLAEGATRAWWSVLLVGPLFGLLRFFSIERRVRLEQLIELNDAYRGTALVLGDIVEADDTYTGEHTRGVVQLALEVARELGLDDQLDQLGRGRVREELVEEGWGRGRGDRLRRRHELPGHRRGLDCAANAPQSALVLVDRWEVRSVG